MGCKASMLDCNDNKSNLNEAVFKDFSTNEKISIMSPYKTNSSSRSSTSKPRIKISNKENILIDSIKPTLKIFSDSSFYDYMLKNEKIDNIVKETLKSYNAEKLYSICEEFLIYIYSCENKIFTKEIINSFLKDYFYIGIKTITNDIRNIKLQKIININQYLIINVICLIELYHLLKHYEKSNNYIIYN
jgi:hypothetical protein